MWSEDVFVDLGRWQPIVAIATIPAPTIWRSLRSQHEAKKQEEEGVLFDQHRLILSKSNKQIQHLQAVQDFDTFRHRLFFFFWFRPPPATTTTFTAATTFGPDQTAQILRHPDHLAFLLMAAVSRAASWSSFDVSTPRLFAVSLCSPNSSI